MLKIKLIRFGQKNQPHYRIVIQEARTKRDGKYLEKIGHYAPVQQPKELEIDLDAYKEWIAKGAQPTKTVANLAARFESGNPFPEKKSKPSKKQLAKQAATKKAAQEEKEAAKSAEDSEKTATQQPEPKQKIEETTKESK